MSLPEHNGVLDLIHIIAWLVLHSFLLSNSISLHGHTTVCKLKPACSSAHMWVLSSLALLWIKLLRTFLYNHFCSMFLILELIPQEFCSYKIIYMFNILRSFWTTFQVVVVVVFLGYINNIWQTDGLNNRSISLQSWSPQIQGQGESRLVSLESSLLGCRRPLSLPSHGHLCIWICL